MNADWVGEDDGVATRMAPPHPTWIFDIDGEIRRRVDAPELQFFHFDDQGRGAVAEVDARVGAVLDTLAETGLDARTLVVFTAVPEAVAARKAQRA